MSEKCVIFVEDKSNRFYNLIETANRWIRFNQKNTSDFKFIRSIFGVQKHIDADNTDHYKPQKFDRVLKVYFEGPDSIVLPDKCNHASTSEEIAVQPTCQNAGRKNIVCNTCGSVVRVEYINKTAHQYSEYVTNKEPTCAREGNEYRTCKVCHQIQNKPIPMIEHEYGEFEVVKEPTFDEEGLKDATCKHCGTIIHEIIPVLPMILAITTNIIDGLTMDEAYSIQLDANIDNLKWSIIEGEIPGLELLPNGLLTGTPTADGVYNIIIQAAYDDDRFTTKAFAVKVSHGAWTVTFDPNGGTCDITTIKVSDGSLIGELPIPEFNDMVFGGWFTAAIDGLKVDANYTVNADVTLYARWGSDTGIEFGDATSTFNINYNGDRTNYQNNPYTFYSRYSNGNQSDLVFQTGISSENGSNNMDSTNKQVKLYMKITNNGAAGSFDVGFDCDSYIPGKGDDKVLIERLANGVSLGGGAFQVTVPYETSIWTGLYSDRVKNRYNDVAVGNKTGAVDTGYAFTMNNIFINSGSYAILEVTFRIP